MFFERRWYRHSAIVVVDGCVFWVCGWRRIVPGLYVAKCHDTRRHLTTANLILLKQAQFLENCLPSLVATLSIDILGFS
jgi:hypothetical protein